MHDHYGRHDEHEHEIRQFRAEHAHRRDVVQRIAGEEEQRPPTTNERVPENSIALTSFEEDAPSNQPKGCRVGSNVFS